MVRVAMGRGGTAATGGETGAALLKCATTCEAACWAAWSAACCASSCMLARADGSGCECIAVVGWELVVGIVSSCGSVAARGYRGRGRRDDGGSGAEAGGAEEVAPGTAVDMVLGGGRVARCVRSHVIS